MAESSSHPDASGGPSGGYRLANVAAAALLAGAGVTTAVTTAGLGLGANGVPGPGFFPVLVGVTLVALAVAMLVQALRGRVQPGEDARLPDRLGARRLVYTAILTAAFLALLTYAGYQVMMTLYVFGLLTLAGGRRIISSAIIAVVFGVGSYLAFAYGLDLTLPNATLPLLSDLGL